MMSAAAPRIRAGLAAAVLLVLFAGIYLPSAGHGFIKDDFGWIAHSRIVSSADVPRLLQTAPTGFYRPLVSLSFAVNQAVCGVTPFCYGLVNTLLALGCAGGIYALGRALGLPPGGAVAAGAIWAFNWHGINMSVLWISGRTALLLVLFATFGAAAFVHGRLWLASALCFAAMLSKEEAVLLPFVLLAYAAVTRSTPRARLVDWWPFAAGALVGETVYFFLRAQSGAFTPATAPSFYQFAFSVERVGSNILQYLDRTATFAVVVVVFGLLIAQARFVLTARARRVTVFGILWWAGTLAVTIFLPVRSSLYACLPSAGIALIAAVLLTESFATVSPAAGKRAVVAGLVLPVLLAPVYHARNRPSRTEADLSSATLVALQDVATTRGAGTVVRLRDNRSERPSLTNPFGTFVQEAADLIVKPPITVWIDPPPDDAGLAGLVAPPHVDVELALRNGAIVPAR
jgi:hypothetical protein